MNVLAAQLLTMCSLFLTMVACCILPYFLVKKRTAGSGFEPGDRYELIISFANCFSGGVFVATFFVGLLPHVREEFLDIFAKSEFDTNFPVTEFVVFTGFIIALLVEHVTIMCQQKRKKCKSKHGADNGEVKEGRAAMLDSTGSHLGSKKGDDVDIEMNDTCSGNQAADNNDNNDNNDSMDEHDQVLTYAYYNY